MVQVFSAKWTILLEQQQDEVQITIRDPNSKKYKPKFIIISFPMYIV